MKFCSFFQIIYLRSIANVSCKERAETVRSKNNFNIIEFLTCKVKKPCWRNMRNFQHLSSTIDSLHLSQNLVFWRRQKKSNLIICSASVKCIFHRLEASNATGKINWTKNAKFWWRPFYYDIIFCYKIGKKNIAG